MGYPHLHRDPEISRAMQRLFDVLTGYERATGRDYLVIFLSASREDVPVYRFGGPMEASDAFRIAQGLPHAGVTIASEGTHRDPEVAAALEVLRLVLDAHYGPRDINWTFLMLPEHEDDIPFCFVSGRRVAPAIPLAVLASVRLV